MRKQILFSLIIVLLSTAVVAANKPTYYYDMSQSPSDLSNLISLDEPERLGMLLQEYNVVKHQVTYIPEMYGSVVIGLELTKRDHNLTNCQTKKLLKKEYYNDVYFPYKMGKFKCKRNLQVDWCEKVKNDWLSYYGTKTCVKKYDFNHNHKADIIDLSLLLKNSNSLKDQQYCKKLYEQPVVKCRTCKH